MSQCVACLNRLEIGTFSWPADIGVKFRQTDYLKVDETPVRCLEPGNGKAATGYFWVYHHAENGVLFDWHKSRANTCLDSVLIDEEGDQSFSGYLQSDGLRAYRTWNPASWTAGASSTTT